MQPPIGWYANRKSCSQFPLPFSLFLSCTPHARTQSLSLSISLSHLLSPIMWHPHCVIYPLQPESLGWPFSSPSGWIVSLSPLPSGSVGTPPHFPSPSFPITPYAPFATTLSSPLSLRIFPASLGSRNAPTSSLLAPP
ncbi:unnamed protein product [Protopolystoma xenopodis]|uniref:Uncharacterized protein n=1 Tax=Protopolystoma xenopodis TaxID=117903 RepID=A0A3S5AT78_9PLAT|nr:unnamed protein product [Protopolystoma xenopodis]